MDWGPDLWRHERIHEGAVEVDPREDVPLDKNKILEIIHGLRPNWPSEQKTSVNADSLEMLQDSIEPYLRVLTDSLQANGVRESQLREDTAHCRGCCIGPLRIERVDLRPDQVLSAGESGVTVIFMLRGSASLKSGNAQAIELSPNKRNLVAFGNNDEWNHRLTGGRNGAGILFIMISSPEEALDCLIQARASMGLLSKEDIGRSRFGTDRQPPYVSRFQENTGNE